MVSNSGQKEHETDLAGRQVGKGPILPVGIWSHLPWLAALVLSDALLLAPAGSPLRVAGGLALLLLPGLAWARWLLATSDRLTRLCVGAGLGFALAMVMGLLLAYLPGPVSFWIELLLLNALALIPMLGLRRRGPGAEDQVWGDLVRLGRRPDRAQPGPGKTWLWIVLIMALAAIFRLAGLGYSEFQGDEALAMISAAEALEGHEDALFLRGKGPGEVLLPMGLWRLTGTIHEGSARLPFAVAGLLMVPTLYLLARRLFSGARSGLGQGGEGPGERAGLIAAGLLALGGFMVAFSRIVQYQALVVWMSGLALLCAWEWRARRGAGGTPWAILTGAFLGAGLLAHYDAILVAPALVYVLVAPVPSSASGQRDSSPGRGLSPRPGSDIWHGLAAVGALLLVAGLFYLPYALDPQASRTGDYLGDRIGDTLLKNNLDSFLRFNVLYTSSYYFILTGLLVLGYLAWALRGAPGVARLPGGRTWVPALAVVAVLGLTLRPDALQLRDLDLAALPFGLIWLGALLSSTLDPGQRAVVLWLAVPFMGYNFAVAVPLTHIYTIVPAWTLLAGLAAAWLIQTAQLALAGGPAADSGPGRAGWLLAACGLVATVLFGGYLFLAYLRYDVELWQDWPDSLPAWTWSPYQDLPPAGFFGFVHRAGWKAVGGLYAEGVLEGDYGSNEEPEVTTWYTRGAPRACDPRPEYYFVADDLVDAWPVDPGSIGANYTPVGRVGLPNGKGLRIYQVNPATESLGELATQPLSAAFDRTATPGAFARSARGSQPAEANLGGLVRLVGYALDTRRAGPGGRVSVTLYWQALSPIPEDYHVFVHLEGDPQAGSAPGIWGQADGRPVCWTYPTFDWRPGQIIADQHAVSIRPDTPPGAYPLLVGMYQPSTAERLEVLDEAGKPLANFVRLATVAIP